MSLLPPGQIETHRFPVVGEREPADSLADPSAWTLTIGGQVERETTLTLDEFLSLPHEEFVFDIHCVTSWTRRGASWRGVRLDSLLAAAAPRIGAGFISFGSYSNRGHHTSLTLEFAREVCWLTHEFEGEPLSVEHGGPVRLVTPGRYFYKSLKWLKTIELLAEDRLGWWEENSGYHNNADPTSGNERFVSGSIRPEQLQRFRDAPSFDKYRGRVMRGLDLRGWSPNSSDLRRLYLKDCDLSRAALSGADLRESNLSLSRLVGADLAGADLSGSDLEGADFTGADLTGADLRDTALSATRFAGSMVGGALFEGSSGLVESQTDYLVNQGIVL